MTNDIVDRLRRWTHSVDAVSASDLMDEAAGEIERLRSLTRFQDGVIRSGDVACLTQSEREAVGAAANAYQRRLDDGVGLQNDGPNECGEIAATLRGLLERMA